MRRFYPTLAIKNFSNPSGKAGQLLYLGGKRKLVHIHMYVRSPMRRRLNASRLLPSPKTHPLPALVINNSRKAPSGFYWDTSKIRIRLPSVKWRKCNFQEPYDEGRESIRKYLTQQTVMMSDENTLGNVFGIFLKDNRINRRKRKIEQFNAICLFTPAYRSWTNYGDSERLHGWCNFQYIWVFVLLWSLRTWTSRPLVRSGKEIG